MAAKITEKQTDAQNGLISSELVKKLIRDYVVDIQVTSKEPTRNPIKLHHYFDIELQRLQDLLSSTTGADTNLVRINLVVNEPNQMNCMETESIGNYLSIIVCCVDESNNSLLNPGANVLVEGFKDFSNGVPSATPGLESVNATARCCVQGNLITQ